MANLGKRIKLLRKQLGLNQVDFANKLGLKSAIAISQYESNRREPDINKLRIISNLCNVSLDYLLAGLGWSFTPSSSSNAIDWFQKRLAKGVKKILIVTYHDSSYGAAKGFVLETDRGVVSMAGSSTRSGYLDGATTAYKEILIEIYNKKIPVACLYFEKEPPVFSQTDMHTLLEYPGIKKDALVEEFINHLLTGVSAVGVPPEIIEKLQKEQATRDKDIFTKEHLQPQSIETLKQAPYLMEMMKLFHELDRDTKEDLLRLLRAKKEAKDILEKLKK